MRSASAPKMTSSDRAWQGPSRLAWSSSATRVGRQTCQVRLHHLGQRLAGLGQAARGVPDPATQRGAECESDLRVAAQEVDEAVPIESEQLARADGAHGRGSRLAGQERHLAEAGAPTQGGDALVSGTLLAVHEDVEAAFRDEEEAVADVALDAGGLAVGVDDAVEVGGELRQGDPIETGEQVSLCEQLGLRAGVIGAEIPVRLVHH